MSRDRYDELLRKAHQLPKESLLRLSILEEAVRVADFLGDEVLGYESRSEVAETASDVGAPDRALVAMAWCLAYADRSVDEFDDTYDLLWKYKWIARQLVTFPDITRAQIASVELDLRKRILSAGYEIRPLLLVQWSNALSMGDVERSRSVYGEWQEAPRDDLSDCRACDVDSTVFFHASNGEHEEALRSAAPILAGTLRCASVPHVTYSNLLEVFVRLGRQDEGDVCQERGYRLVSRDSSYVDSIADHLKYLVHRENWDRALRVFERHWAWSLDSTCPRYVFEFDIAAWMLFARLSARGNRRRKLRVPHAFTARADDDRYRPSELAAWFATRVRKLARRFDDRNGNDAVSGSIDDTMEYTGVTRRLDGAQP